MSKPLRILMLIPQLGYGGAESAFLRLADFMSNHAELTIGLMSRNYGSEHYSNEHRVSSHRAVLLDEANTKQHGYLGKFLKWRRMLRKLRVLKSEHDVTISFLSGPNLLNTLAVMPQRTIVSERGSKLYHRGIPRLRKFLWLSILDPFIYKRAAIIVPASIGYSKEIAEIGGDGITFKIHPIEGGIEAESLLSDSEEQPDTDIARFCQNPVAIYSGRLDRGKGVDLLLPAFADVVAKQHDARLLLIGDGPAGNEIISKCRSLGLSVTTNGDPEAAVFMAGYRAKPIRHFRLCKLFLFPSLHEGLGNSLIEGVASGIPVLAADCRWGPRSILSGGKLQYEGPSPDLPHTLAHGVLVPLPDAPGATDVWAAEMARILAEPQPPRPDRDARRAAIARYDIATTGELWMGLVRQIVAEAGPR